MSDNRPSSADVASNGDESSCPMSPRRRSLTTQWASVVRGDYDQNSSTLAAASSVAPGGSSSRALLDQPSGSDSVLVESSGSEGPLGSHNAGRQRRPAWKRPMNGAANPICVIGGAGSWPALSETTTGPVIKLSSDNSRRLADGSVSLSQAPILSQPPQRPMNDRSSGATTSAKPRSRNRNGGGGTPAGIAPPPNTLNQTSLRAPPFMHSMVPTVVDASARGTRPVGGGNEHSQRNNSRRNGGYGPRPRRDAQFHNNHGRGRDQSRRDVLPHLPYGPPPPPMSYIASPLHPGAPRFLALPAMRVFPGQIGFEVGSPSFYYPIPSDSFRPIHVVPTVVPPSAIDNTLTNSIVKQIDFYFSDNNLMRDSYLRSKMDDQGWVPISLVASFPRIKQMTNDISLVMESLRYSTVVEMQGDKVRRRNEWARWLPPSDGLANSGSQITGAPDNELATSLQGISIDNTEADLIGNNDAMEGRVEMNAERTEQSAEEARAISI
ncbi:la-related protein 1C-like [Andrographis paniculata]|uniref:la-related protein 1C-like n=1 Tax=Andrographis paniculata TaxID=175694 RepID=UPI0021E74550|nr:la-related protein 1C-like [Andrographis paniculata]